MWKLLYQLASPKLFYRITGQIIPGLGIAALLLLTIGLVWGLVFAPADYQQGEAYRIIFIHVPCAFLSMALYAAMGFWAILFLVWRIKIAGLFLSQAAVVGAWMAFLALVTGSLWGKPMWGTFWVWDARLTSELILCLLYVGILATYHALSNKDQADKMIAILTLVGLLDLPVIHYSVYWWNTLHQGSTLSVLQKPKIAPSMLYPLLISLMGFAFYCAWVVLLRVRNSLLLRERKQRWVESLIKEGV